MRKSSVPGTIKPSNQEHLESIEPLDAKRAAESELILARHWTLWYEEHCWNIAVDQWLAGFASWSSLHNRALEECCRAQKNKQFSTGSVAIYNRNDFAYTTISVHIDVSPREYHSYLDKVVWRILIHSSQVFVHQRVPYNLAMFLTSFFDYLGLEGKMCMCPLC